MRFVKFDVSYVSRCMRVSRILTGTSTVSISSMNSQVYFSVCAEGLLLWIENVVTFSLRIKSMDFILINRGSVRRALETIVVPFRP